MNTVKEILRFILALILFIPFSIVVLIAYSGMLLIRELMIFMGEWQE